MKWLSTKIIEYIKITRRLEELNHANPYWAYTFCYRKDLKESILYFTKLKQVKKEIKDLVWRWNYFLFLFNRTYFYKKFKISLLTPNTNK